MRTNAHSINLCCCCCWVLAFPPPPRCKIQVPLHCTCLQQQPTALSLSTSAAAAAGASFPSKTLQYRCMRTNAHACNSSSHSTVPSTLNCCRWVLSFTLSPHHNTEVHAHHCTCVRHQHQQLQHCPIRVLAFPPRPRCYRRCRAR
jgi:hypothetical protein